MAKTVPFPGFVIPEEFPVLIKQGNQKPEGNAVSKISEVNTFGSGGLLGDTSPSESKDIPVSTPPVDDNVVTPIDLAEGDLNLDGEQPTFTPPSKSTAEELTGLLASGSPYIDAARQSGKEYAHSRGLLNSSLAAGAAERAAIEAAFPIASQDSAFAQELELQSRQGTIDERLVRVRGEIDERIAEARDRTSITIANIQSRSQLAAVSARGAIDRELARINGDIQADLYKLQGQINAGLSEQDAGYAMDRLVFQAEVDVGMQSANLSFAEMELNAKLGLEYDKLEQADKHAFSTALAAINARYMNSYLAILADTQLQGPSKESAIAVLNVKTQSEIDDLATLYDVDLSFAEEGEEEGSTEEGGEEETGREEGAGEEVGEGENEEEGEGSTEEGGLSWPSEDNPYIVPFPYRDPFSGP